MKKIKITTALLVTLTLTACGSQPEEDFPVEGPETQALLEESTQDVSVKAAEKAAQKNQRSTTNAVALHDPLAVLDDAQLSVSLNPEPPLDPTEDVESYIGEPEDPLTPHYADPESYIPE